MGEIFTNYIYYLLKDLYLQYIKNTYNSIIKHPFQLVIDTQSEYTFSPQKI